MPETKQKPMRNIVTCGTCGKAFQSAYEVKTHIRETHIRQRLIDKQIVNKAEEIKEEELKTAPGQKVIQPNPVPPPVPPPEPIVLRYKFFGMCPVCRHEPRTLMLDVGEDLYAICYCNSCDKKLKQVKVVPLE